MSPDQERETWTLRMYRVTYESRPGKGHGDPHFAEQPHKTCPFNERSALFNYLRRFGFAPESAWLPVEDTGEKVEGLGV